MSTVSESARPTGKLSQTALKALILAATCLLTFACLVLPEIFNNQNLSIKVGDVSNQEVLAPSSLTFESDVLTEEARQQAANAVEPVYLPSDPAITKSQLEKLNNAIYFISTVRQDEHSTRQQKLSDLSALEDLNLSDTQKELLLALDEESWNKISTEANRVLETVLRDSLRNDQVGRARANLPALVDFSFSQDQNELIIALVSPLIVPTSLYSEEQTNLAREHARTTIEPVSRQISAGEVIVRRGQVIHEAELEALEVYGLAEPTDQTNLYIRAAVMVLLCGSITGLYYNLRSGQPFTTLKSILMVSVVFVLFLGLARFLVIDRTLIPYIYPVAAFGLLGQRLAALALAVDVALQLHAAQLGFHLLGPIGRIGPDPRAGIAPRQQVVHRLAVMQGGIADMVTSYQLVLPVHAHMVLVAIVGFAVLLGPAGINVLL